MPCWRVCKPYLISAEDTAELMRLGKLEGQELAKTDRWQSLAKAMRAECPVPGDDWHKLFVVSLSIGAELPDHSHREHTMVLYPEACDPVLIEGVLFHPEKGDMLHMSPRTHHSVPPVTTERLTIALLVKDANHSSSK